MKLETIRQMPDVAARVVVRAYQGDGDIQNAYDMLVSALGIVRATSELGRAVEQINDREDEHIDMAHILAQLEH